MEPQETPSETHMLAIILPLQGHINPTVQLCKRLIAKGIRVTIVTTASTGKNLIGNDLISIETVPDIAISGSDHLDIYEIFVQSFQASITQGLDKIIHKYSSLGFPFKAILYDSVIPWALDMAHENGLKGAALFTQTCTVCSLFYHLHKGSLVIPLEEGCEVTLPGIPVMGLKDLPSYVFDMSSTPSILRLQIGQFSTFGEADWRLFNTFEKLEDEIVKWMAIQHHILTIGPTIPSMYIDKRLLDNYDYGLNLVKTNVESCTKWLDTKEDRSVIYISFGSLVNVEEKQMEELARGLIDTQCSFIWVVKDSEKSKFPQGVISEASGKGLIVNWCNQLEVLSHRSILCFVTHCGWNSTLEALSLGVPMVAMPQWTDQTTNAKLIVDIWKSGVRVKIDENGIVGREELVACVKEVMEGEKGDELRRNAEKWKELSKEAISEGGSSDRNIEEFVTQLLSK